MESAHYERLFIGLIFCKNGAAQRRGGRPATSPKLRQAAEYNLEWKKGGL
jgi:hypothetical protein